MAARPVFNATLGEYFAELRLAHNWTQRQATAIAFNRKIAGISKQTIWRIEKGKIKHPEADALRGLAALYGVSYEELVVRCVEAQYGVKLVPETCADRKALPTPAPVIHFDAAERRLLQHYRRLPAVLQRRKSRIGPGLGLLFVDLIGLDVRFETIRAITSGIHVDLVVTFPDMDVKRNADQADRDRWTAFFGGTRWQEAVARWQAHRTPEGSVPAMLVNLYRRELRDQLGYTHSAAVRPMVNSKRATLYRPLFASRHELGLKFWNSISKRDRNGQGDLFV